MSDSNDSKNSLHQRQGAEGPSPESFEQDKANVLEFLKYPQNKRKFVDFVEGTYKDVERERIERMINRYLYEKECEDSGSTSYYKPGHIGTLMYQYLNMIGVESAFSSGLQHTKSSLTKTVQQRVDEINTLLRGVGGFNRQIKSSFSRSAVNYLEQEDPRNNFRERVVFTVNIADFELRYPLDESALEEITEDGRTLRRLVWDESVNTVAEIISNTGLKPKYVKNDKNKCQLSMRQYLLNRHSKQPDEYFEFTLKHINEQMKQQMLKDYKSKNEEFDQISDEINEQLKKKFMSKSRRSELEQEFEWNEKDREFFLATTPDPSEIDTGIIFSIYVNTLKDYGLTKDKMQVIMTKFILALSKVASDKSMDEQVNTVFQQKQAKAQNFQNLDVDGGKKEKIKVMKVKKKSA